MIRECVVRRFRPAVAAATVAGLVLVRAAGAQGGSGAAVEGTVRDAASGRPLPNAQVFVVGTTVGASTSDAGTYRIPNAPVGSAVQLRVRLIGYRSDVKTVAVTLGQTARADFTLSQSAVQLDQVVVTGTGAAVETRKLGNTVGSVDMNDLRSAPIQTPSEALAARVPGVTVSPSGGTSGAGSRIRIRGSASISQSNNPIIYIDGIRMDNGGSGAGGMTASSRLDDIDPNSIERVEILKGAAAATLYGTEASNGVIQIFTKKGAQGPARWTVDLQRSQIGYPDRVAPNAGFARTQAQADTLSRIYGMTVTPYVPFEYNVTRQLWETGFNNTLNGSVNGGAEKVTYFVAGRYEGEDGPFTASKVGGLAEDKLRRVQGSLSLNVLPTDKITIGFNSRFTTFRIDGIEGSNSIYSPYAQSMYAKPENGYCLDANLRRTLETALGNARCELAGNPFGNNLSTTLREALQHEISQEGSHYTGSLNSKWTPTTGLVLDATLGIDHTDTRNVDFLPFGNNVDAFSARAATGSRSVGDIRQQNVTLDLKTNWDREFGGAYQSVFTLGAQGFVTSQKTETASNRNFPGPGLEVVTAGDTPGATEGIVRQVNAGYFAQEQLSYNDWATVTVGARYDYNSAFGESAGGAFYPKLGLSVVPSDLGWWRWTTVSQFRVRGAIGRAGRQPGAFDKFTTYSSIRSGSGSGLLPSNLGNPDLRPEVSTEIEGGFELGLFNNRAQLSVTNWNRTVNDALVNKQFPISGGFTARQLTNVGKLKGSGWELGLNGSVVNRASVGLDLFANGAYLKQKVVSLGGAPAIKVQDTYVRIRGFIEEGYAPGSLFGAKLMAPCSSYGNPAAARGGCLQSGQTVFDLNNDRVPDTPEQLRARLGTPINPTNLILLRADDDGDANFLDHYQGKIFPDWSGAFGGTLRVGRAWRIASLFEYKGGNYTITNLTDAFRNAHATLGRNRIATSRVEATLLNPASTADQRVAAAEEWLGLVGLSPYDGLNQNDAGDFVRWRELSVTWNAPQRLAGRVGARDLALVFGVRNLLLWTRYPGTDPEINYAGITNSLAANQTDNNFYESSDTFGLPMPRRFTFSARLGF